MTDPGKRPFFTEEDSYDTSFYVHPLRTQIIFPKSLIRNTGCNLKVWDQVAEAIEAFPNIRMFKIDSPLLKHLGQYCPGRVLVLLYFSLYWGIKLTFPTECRRDCLGGTNYGRYMERMLVRRVDQELPDCPTFHGLDYSDYRLVCAQMVLGPRPRMTEHWTGGTSAGAD